MTAKDTDNVGGLPELPNGDVAFREDCLSKWQYAHSDEQMRAYGELCRAAPSGGDWRDAYEGAREDLLDWKGRALRAEAELRRLGYTGITPDSAPAGSGEVEDTLLARLEGRAAYFENVSRDPKSAGLFREAAALLRKLQQGADGELDALILIRDQWLEENGPGGWIDELRNAVDRANALADRWDHIYGRFADELRSALERPTRPASQDQEGGSHE